MKLIDLLELFQDVDTEVEDEKSKKAMRIWNDVLNSTAGSKNPKDQVNIYNLQYFDWAFSWLADVIRAGAFEDYPQPAKPKTIVGRTFVCNTFPNPPKIIVDSSGVVIDAEIIDPQIPMKPATVDKAALLKDIDNRITNLEICEISVKSGGDYRAARDCWERVKELNRMKGIIESEDFNTQRIGENGYGIDE